MTTWEKLKDLWPILVGVGTAFSGAVIVLVVTYINVFVGGIAMDKLKSDAAKLYLQQVISAELTAKGVAGGTALTTMSGNIDGNTTAIEHVAKDVERVEDKAERIATILMED